MICVFIEQIIHTCTHSNHLAQFLQNLYRAILNRPLWYASFRFQPNGYPIMNVLLKTLLSTTLLTSLSLMTYANPLEHQHPVSNEASIDISSETPSLKEDLAYLQVFSEICPQLIGQNRNFDQAYRHAIAEKLVDSPNSELAMQFLNQDDETYQALLQHFRQDIATASSEDNRVVCLDMIDWDKKK